MKDSKFASLTDEELLAEKAKAKSAAITNAVLCGFIIGIAIYSTYKNGLGLFTFLPLFFVYMMFNSNKKNTGLKDELAARNIKE
ncbi:FUSC family protein [Mucilaginibacter auburnensis]|uniref:FUSC family protein n=1 Tax=Mucilaginibacter auburnensis TaxID=1457233 RepID=A0A2H9VUY0_9SPHI|nr:FUSC family protein [Mucilaginibacter auburnensis]PJJ84618.1 hypothetical protein CLV57_1632 [Mucilaginibacter auburnensis]